MDTCQLEGSAYISEPENLKYEEPLLLDNNCNIKNTSILISDSDNGSDMNYGSEVLEGIIFSECDVNFKDVKKFEDFTIQVDSLILDTEIPTHLRRKYYELCSSHDMFLHDNLRMQDKLIRVLGLWLQVMELSSRTLYTRLHLT